jgi:hypothetical protein
MPHIHMPHFAVLHPVVLNSATLSAYITILVAFVAGAFSLLNLTVSKENKISDFRQAWIDALRDDIATFVAQSQWIYTQVGEHVYGNNPDYANYLASVKDTMMAMNQASTRVKLRLREEERNPKALMEGMKKLQDYLERPPTSRDALSEAFRDSSREVEIYAALILREEWSVVKTGEKGYRIAKWLANLCIALSIAMLFLLVFGYFQISQGSK